MTELPRDRLDPAALGAFLTGLAHDLRSPIGVVSEAVGELRGDLGAGMTDDQRLLAALAERGFLRLGRIADTLSLAGTLESGAFELMRAPIDLGHLVRGATAAAVAIQPRRTVELVCELPGGPCPAVADEKRLCYAISELTSNAIRHAHSVTRVRLTLAAGQALIVIEDDGKGVADDERATLFRRFVRSRPRSGLGLGLSIAQDVIAAHAGTLTLDASTLPAGRSDTIGARFTVTLPIGRA